MIKKRKKSFFERITGSVKMDEFDDDLDYQNEDSENIHERQKKSNYNEDSETDETSPLKNESVGQLSVDVINRPDKIIIKAMVAGVKPHDLDVQISRDMITVTGTREEIEEIEEQDYYHRELYWGSFTRNIILPEEIDVELAEAQEKHGILEIHLPKIDKNRKTKLQVKSS
jgi:HSP20 family molecular chaperone IbpA